LYHSPDGRHTGNPTTSYIVFKPFTVQATETGWHPCKKKPWSGVIAGCDEVGDDCSWIGVAETRMQESWQKLGKAWWSLATRKHEADNHGVLMILELTRRKKTLPESTQFYCSTSIEP
jgi:hypothetical protein